MRRLVVIYGDERVDERVCAADAGSGAVLRSARRGGDPCTSPGAAVLGAGPHRRGHLSGRKFADSGFRFSREELAQNATLVTATGNGVFLTIPLDKKRNLLFSRTAAGAMEEWLGAQFLVLVRRSVRATWGWSIGLGLFFILTTGFSRMSPMDIGWLTLGFGMLACGVLARARPAAWIWWLDGSLSGMLILLIIVDVLRTQQSHWRLAFAALLVWTAVNRFRLASHVGERLRSLSNPVPL